MLRILSSSQLEGYVIKGRGGPPWELLAGTVAKIQQDGEALLVCISGSNIENGMIKTRTAKVVFVDDYGEYRKMLKTRVVASKIQIGSYISVLCKRPRSVSLRILNIPVYGIFPGTKGR